MYVYHRLNTSALLFGLLFTVTKTRSQGHVTVNVNIVTKDFWKQGFRNGAHEPQTTTCTSNQKCV